MDARVDWYSFSFPVVMRPDSPAVVCAGDALIEILPAELVKYLASMEWQPLGHGRAPYDEGWEIPNTNVYLWVNHALPHATMEATGMGCQWLDSVGWLDRLIEKTHERCTRIDIAADFLTDVTPVEFVAAGVTGRMSARAHLRSDSGETVYVGSQKSDRFARVYRYNEPHPRADKLRVEMVHRKEYAKAVARLWDGPIKPAMDVVLKVANSGYDWQHALMGEKYAPIKMQANVTDARSEAGTVRWLIKQAAPAFKRLVAEGAIKDPEAFFTKYFLEG